MRSKLLLVAMVAAIAAGAATPLRADVTPEIRPFVGVYVPTGDHRDLLKDAVMVGAQGGVEVSRWMHVIGTFAYAGDKDKTRFNRKDVHIYGYDAGLEAFHVAEMENGWQFRPFLGLGAGGRTYDPRAGDTQTNFAGYASLGGEFQSGSLALRLEARDYVTRFEGLAGELEATTRNDLMFALGAALHW